MCETKATTTNYETTTCTRCGGSGRYSFNLMHGSVCYGCGGSGKKLTKRGKAAKAFADQLLTMTFEEFAALESPRLAKYVWSFHGKAAKFRRVQKHPDRESYNPLINGEPWEFYGGVAWISGSEKVRLIPAQADIDAINDYQANLTKAGTPRKRQAA